MAGGARAEEPRREDAARLAERGPAPWAALRAWSLAVFAAWIAVPFLAAGTLRWWPGWAHLAALGTGLLAHRAHVAARNPALRERRQALAPGVKRWDLAWNAAFWPLLAGTAVSAGLEFRRAGSTLPAPLWVAGAILLAAGLAVSARAMASNPWFEGVVRIAPGEGQRVVDAGPYRIVRHPGYAGLVLWAAATPFLLLSRAAMAGAVATAAWIVLRTALEDSALRRELPGYAGYARRVRWRLVPFLW